MRRWFLPREPDVIGLLRGQAVITLTGVHALLAWAQGDATQASAVREAEHRADDVKRALQRELRAAFSTPLDPEDLYELSERLDLVLAAAKDLVREAEVLMIAPDLALVEMAGCIDEAVQHLVAAFAALPADADTATLSADAAKRAARRLEHSYRSAMSALLDVEDIAEQLGRRELYRRASHLADAVIGVVNRVWYATVKQA